MHFIKLLILISLSISAIISVLALLKIIPSIPTICDKWPETIFNKMDGIGIPILIVPVFLFLFLASPLMYIGPALWLLGFKKCYVCGKYIYPFEKKEGFNRWTRGEYSEECHKEYSHLNCEREYK